MEQTLLSVCIITYNHENYIREAIEGVLMQKVNFNYEIIVADDCSTDNTRKIILEYVEKYPNIFTLIFQERNVGASQNWLDLLNKPKSKYIAYFEGDDYWTDPLKLQKQVDFLEANKSCVLSFHRSYKLYEGSNCIQKVDIIFKDRFNTRDILSSNWNIYTATILFRNQFSYPKWFLKVKHGDYALLLFLSTFGELGFIDSYMSVYRKHSGGVSNSFGNNINITLNETLVAFEENNPKFREIIRKKRSQLLVNHGFLQKGIPRYKYLLDSFMLNNLIIFHILFRYCVLIRRRLFA